LQKIQYGPNAKYSIRGKSNKYMRRYMLEILAGHTMNNHIVPATGGDRHHVMGGGRRPHHIMWPADNCNICPRMYFLFELYLGRLRPNTPLAHIIVPVIIVVPWAPWAPWAPWDPWATWAPWAHGARGAHGAPGPQRAHGTTIMAGTVIWNNYMGKWNIFAYHQRAPEFAS